jgi:hypothetical protein
MTFTPNRKFRRKYRHIHRRDPIAANLLLLLAELADEAGQVVTNPEEIARLMEIRFRDPKGYHL